MLNLQELILQKVFCIETTVYNYLLFSVGRARKLCSDSLTYAESVKKQLSIIYEAEYKKHLAEEERKRHEEEAERAKTEMWEIEC